MEEDKPKEKPKNEWLGGLISHDPAKEAAKPEPQKPIPAQTPAQVPKLNLSGDIDEDVPQPAKKDDVSQRPPEEPKPSAFELALAGEKDALKKVSETAQEKLPVQPVQQPSAKPVPDVPKSDLDELSAVVNNIPEEKPVPEPVAGIPEPIKPVATPPAALSEKIVGKPAAPAPKLDLSAEQKQEEKRTAIPKKNSVLAAFLSAIVPGAGQIYNEQTSRGIIIFLASFLIGPWFYGIVNAYDTAEKINAGKPVPGKKGLCLAIVISALIIAPLVVFYVKKIAVPKPVQTAVSAKPAPAQKQAAVPAAKPAAAAKPAVKPAAAAISAQAQEQINKLGSSDTEIRRSAAKCLAEMKDPAVLQALVKATKDSFPGVRWWAVTGLGELNSARALPAVKQLFKDQNPNVRNAAKQSYDKLKKFEK